MTIVIVVVTIVVVGDGVHRAAIGVNGITFPLWGFLFPRRWHPTTTAATVHPIVGIGNELLRAALLCGLFDSCDLVMEVGVGVVVLLLLLLLLLLLVVVGVERLAELDGQECLHLSLIRTNVLCHRGRGAVEIIEIQVPVVMSMMKIEVKAGSVPISRL
jgi:hypothetical protein